MRPTDDGASFYGCPIRGRRLWFTRETDSGTRRNHLQQGACDNKLTCSLNFPVQSGTASGLNGPEGIDSEVKRLEHRLG